tara:strand:+ start:287 stop:508 length:222 start_codon:yes stop_codon:yes gene_type:complete
MPIYEYYCTSCFDEMEIFHGIIDKQKKKCLGCGGRLKRLISRNAFHLKGGGWYKDGYTGVSNKGSEKNQTPPQ